MLLNYDIIVVGGGHAGCEAAVAAARLGSRVLLITMDMSKCAAMSCNPAVGGVAKGQIVREIDALGGQMGIITDRSTIQFRMLGRSKGAAMWSPRAQCDKTRFSELWRETLENTPGLYLWQDSVVDLIVEEAPLQDGISSRDGLSLQDGDPSFHDSASSLQDGVFSRDGSSSTSTQNFSPEADGYKALVNFAKEHPGEHITEHILSSNEANDRTDPGTKAAEPGLSRKITGVKTALGVEFNARAVVLTVGTFLNGLIHVGGSQVEGGRLGDASSKGLTERLVELGFEAGRMKTGTPARLDGRTIDFSRLTVQEGDAEPSKFSFSPETEPVPVRNQLPCYIAGTSAEVHDILRTGFAASPLFNGTIRGIGPRYCPSIEDKLRTFADKDSHQLFLEPEGVTTNEYYLNGFSSSLPWQVQIEALRHIEGLENVHLFRPGYAIEYDYFPPTQLHHTLQTKLIGNLYFAGQINGTTGYEEAAAQGLMAGINAHLAVSAAKEQKDSGGTIPKGNLIETKCPKSECLQTKCPEETNNSQGKFSEGKVNSQSFILRRDEAYIGVLIDDLVTKGVDEPYRMFTSRAEYRILLRGDNADLRLTPKGRQLGLIDDRRWSFFEQKKSNVESLKSFVHGLSIAPDDLRDYLFSVGSAPLTQGRKLSFILSRGEIALKEVAANLPVLADFIKTNSISDEEIEQVEIEIKYRGYIEREKLIAEKLRRLENVAIPADFEFTSLESLTMEARQKLSRIKPSTIGQASRIPGVSPADINVLLVFFGR